MLINSSQLNKIKDKKKDSLKEDNRRRQKLTRSNSSKLIKIKDNRYPYKNLINKFLNIGLLKAKKLIPSKKNFLLLLAFLTKHGEIIKRKNTVGVSLKIYRKLIRLLKKTRELKIIPFTFNFDI